MAQFGKERFPQGYQVAVGMAARELLHKNSIELVEILAKHNLLTPDSKIFELGAGPARNLYYMYKTLEEGGYDTTELELTATDLWKDASLNFMDPSIRDIVKFMLRELRKEFETPKHPRLYHDYHQLIGEYEMVEETSSNGDTNYFIWVLKRK